MGRIEAQESLGKSFRMLLISNYRNDRCQTGSTILINSLPDDGDELAQ
jgi:hypothetical protein